MNKIPIDNKYVGSPFDDFLREEGLSEEVEAGAIKKLIACQLQETLENEHPSLPLIFPLILCQIASNLIFDYILRLHHQF
jgi:hypothetical protein